MVTLLTLLAIAFLIYYAYGVVGFIKSYRRGKAMNPDVENAFMAGTGIMIIIILCIVIAYDPIGRYFDIKII